MSFQKLLTKIILPREFKEKELILDIFETASYFF